MAAAATEVKFTPELLTAEIGRRYHNAKHTSRFFNANQQRLGLAIDMSNMTDIGIKCSLEEIAHFIAGTGVDPVTLSSLDSAALGYIKSVSKVNQDDAEDRSYFLAGMASKPDNKQHDDVVIPNGTSVVVDIKDQQLYKMKAEHQQFFTSLDEKQRNTLSVKVRKLLKHRSDEERMDMISQMITELNHDKTEELFGMYHSDDTVSDFCMFVSGTEIDVSDIEDIEDDTSDGYRSALKILKDKMAKWKACDQPEGYESFVQGMLSL